MQWYRISALSWAILGSNILSLAWFRPLQIDLISMSLSFLICKVNIIIIYSYKFPERCSIVYILAETLPFPSFLSFLLPPSHSLFHILRSLSLGKQKSGVVYLQSFLLRLNILERILPFLLCANFQMNVFTSCLCPLISYLYSHTAPPPPPSAISAPKSKRFPKQENQSLHLLGRSLLLINRLLESLMHTQ